MQRFNACPAAGTLLSRCVLDMIDQIALGKVIGLTQHIGGNADQITAQLAGIPLGEQVCNFMVFKAADRLEHQIALGNQLHIGIFNAIVHHLDKMSGTIRAHIGTARCAVLGLCRDCLQNGCNLRIALAIAARHDRGTKTRTGLTARYAHTEIVQAVCGQTLGTAAGIGKERVAAVQYHITRLHKRNELVEHLIDRVACLNHQQHTARLLERRHQLGQRKDRMQVCIGFFLHNGTRYVGVAVKTGYLKAVIGNITCKAAAHNRQADYADITQN